MRIHGWTTVVLLATSACRAADRPADTTMPAVPEGIVVEQAGDIMHRREAQPYIDSAYAWMASRGYSDAERVLRLAPPLLREHADMPTSAAKLELRAGAMALDSLVARFGAGAIPPVEDLRAVTVRINLAEAEHHRSQAAVARGTEAIRRGRPGDRHGGGSPGSRDPRRAGAPYR